MEVDGWVQVSLGIQLLENRPKIAIPGPGTIYNVFKACLGAQLTICAQK